MLTPGGYELMTIIRYVCSAVLLPSVISRGQFRVSMVVADGLVHIWPRDISNHHDGGRPKSEAPLCYDKTL